MLTAPAFSIYLLGAFSVKSHGASAPLKLRRKTRALLAYLAATGQAHNRQTLADLFCTDTADPLGALRSILSRLRRHLGPDALLTDGSAVWLNQVAGWVDCLAFAQVLEADLGAHSLETLAATIDLYQSEFLTDISGSSSTAFEFWLLHERARYRQLYERGLAALITRLITQGDLAEAIRRAQTLARQNPLREEAHARLIWLYGRTGQREAALAQYEQCRVLLHRELAVEPAPELQALRDEIVVGELSRAYTLPAAVAQPVFVAQPGGNFVGRAAEMARLRQVWQAVGPGYSRVAILVAAAGMGKSRLVREFARTLPEAEFLVGECYESARTLSYAPWLDLLEAWAARLDTAVLERLSPSAAGYLTRLLPALARRLPRQRRAEPPAGGELTRLFTAVSEFLLELHQTPLLIFLDDLQWADEASLQLFHFLSRRSPPGKVLFIGAYRPEETGDTPALQLLVSDMQRRSPLQLSLPPLDKEAITQLAGQLWPGLLPADQPQVADTLLRATGGNPLFVAEILRELAPLTVAPPVLPVPPSASELIQRRLNRLPGSGRQVVEAMAILDGPATPAQAQQASGRSQEETAAAIDQALRHGLLQPHPATTAPCYDFAHDLIRQAVVAQLSPVRRQLLHRRATAALEPAGAPAATLAYHWQMAGDMAKEGHYAALAGEQAAAVYNNEEAARYLARAISLTNDPAQRVGLMRRQGEVLQLLGRYQEAGALYEQALALAETAADRRAAAACRVALARLARLKGDYAAATNWLAQARADYQALDDQPGVAETLWGLGAIYWSQLDYARALDCFQEQLAIARHLDDRPLIAKAVGSMAVAYTERGDYQQALNCYHERLQIDLAGNDRLSLAKTAGNMGMVYAGMGDDGHALACYHFLLKETLASGDRQNVFVALGNMIGVYTAQGDDALAGRLARQAITLGRALDLPLYLCEYLYASAELCARQERYAEAMPLNEEAIEIAMAIGRTDIQLPAQLLLLRLRLAGGELDRDTAVHSLQSWLDDWPAAQEQAAILYDLWRLEPGADSLRQQAAMLYHNLYAQTPNVTYRRRYQKLTGKGLPPPPTAPPPPEIVAHSAIDLDVLLHQVDQLIVELAAGVFYPS